MTTKQIAEAVGKDPATVARWIQSVSYKVQEVFRKVQGLMGYPWAERKN